ncbi:MAG: ABC transporter ATP-binding protein, partial [Burkholderiales bacterium]|nr:ABC transporter ATP-binding protein [Phycisphaerae bacterium]
MNDSASPLSRALLQANALSVTLGGKPVLRDIALTLAPGEILTFIGPNGSGKTTLLRALLGQIRFSGSVLWFDRPLDQWKLRDLARQVAYMPQTPSCDPGDTVIDVLRLGRTPHQGFLGMDTDADEAVITEIANSLELDQLLEREMDTLSGGQRQRVFLGRCLAQSPQALLLDEPATFLDLRHQVELYRLLRRLAAERH